MAFELGGRGGVGADMFRAGDEPELNGRVHSRHFLGVFWRSFRIRLSVNEKNGNLRARRL